MSGSRVGELEPAAAIEPFDLGQLLVGNGLISEAALAECLGVQREVARAGLDDIPRLGELLIARGLLSREQVVAALSQQAQTILYCPRCDVQVNVQRRPDVREVHCIRCRGTLVSPREPRDVKVSDDSIIFISREPVPREVEEASKDRARKFGKYTLINEVGRGGAGVVHRAWDHYLSQFVALKRIHSGSAQGTPGLSDPESRTASLLKEARSAARLRHPNIVTVYEVGRVAREFYVSMEFLEGATLGDHLRKAQEEGKVSPFFEQPRRYLSVFRDIARAIHYAHTRPSPIIHCDLKPSNIFVERTGRATVLDFGLARTLRSREITEAGSVAGTPNYMAPEQASGHPEDIDARTDVYGVGAVLYETLTGRPPFAGTLGQVLRNALVEPPRPPAELLVDRGAGHLVPRIPTELTEICLRCLEKSREDRFQTAEELGEAIEEVLRQQTPTPQTAMPAAMPAPAPPPAPVAPRRPLGWIVIASLVGGLALGAGMMMLAGGRGSAGRVSNGAALRKEVEAALARFRPDSAVEFCRAALADMKEEPERGEAEVLLDRAQWVDRMRSGVIQGLNRVRLSRPELRLRGGQRLGQVEILKATPDALVIYGSGGSKDVGWDRLEPTQVVELALGSGAPMGEAEKLGLALYEGATGLGEAARERLRKLRGGVLDIPAARELSRLGGLD